MGLPKLYLVKSSPECVEKPVERQVVEVIENVSFRGKERLPSDRYKLEDIYPYEVDILRAKPQIKMMVMVRVVVTYGRGRIILLFQ